MGIWGSNPAVGSILGTIIPSFWADTESSNPPWGWSFIVPAFIIAGMGVVIFFFLVTGKQVIVEYLVGTRKQYTVYREIFAVESFR